MSRYLKAPRPITPIVAVWIVTVETRRNVPAVRLAPPTLHSGEVIHTMYATLP